jgi:hypothetical protein
MQAARLFRHVAIIEIASFEAFNALRALVSGIPVIDGC